LMNVTTVTASPVTILGNGSVGVIGGIIAK
jgi:hypothetical protein